MWIDWLSCVDTGMESSESSVLVGWIALKPFKVLLTSHGPKLSETLPTLTLDQGRR
jgi:hypothetical protein